MPDPHLGSTQPTNRWRQNTAAAGFWLVYALPPLALMAIIFWLGSDRGSAAHTGTLLDRFLTHWFPGFYSSVSPARLHELNVALRKVGHFFGYALLCGLDARALRAAMGNRGWRLAAAAWVMAGAWAVVDEYHQSFSPSRGASLQDVLLDCGGAAVGLLLYSLVCRR